MSKESKETKESTDVVLNDNDKRNLTRLDRFDTVEDAHSFAKVLVESKLVPPSYNTPEKVILAISQGKELGLGAVTSLYNLYFISGKPTLSVHIINALIKRGNIAHVTEEDYVPIDENHEVCSPANAVTVRTTIKFFRKWVYGSNPDKDYKILEEKISYTLREAEKAGLAGKENWKNHPKAMLWNRCFVLGARRVGADFLNGVYETSEMLETQNVNFDVDEEGAVINIDNIDLKNK